MSQSVQVVDFFIRFLHELNYFVRNPTKNNYFTFNRTGNAQQMVDLSPWDSGGGVIENRVLDQNKPKMVITYHVSYGYNMIWKSILNTYLLQQEICNENLLDDHNVPRG